MSQEQMDFSSDPFSALAQGAVIVRCARGPAHTPLGAQIGTVIVPKDEGMLRSLVRNGASYRKPADVKVVKAKAAKPAKGKKTAKPAAPSREIPLEDMLLKQFMESGPKAPVVPVRNQSDDLAMTLAQMKADMAMTENKPGSSDIAQIPFEKVTFHTQIGTIRAKVRVLEDDMAIGLVFDSEDDITFVPNGGDNLDITIQDRRFSVMYPNVLFTWVNKVSKIMVLIKVT